MYPYYTIFWWLSLYTITFLSIAFNESVYPSTYIFGGPDKVLMLTMANMTSTDDIDYYYNCKCVNGSQAIKATFTETDQTAQETTYDIRALLFMSAIVIIVKMGLEFGGKQFIFAVGRKTTVDILYFLTFGTNLFCTIAAVTIFTVQTETECDHPLECENESVWDRYNFSLLLIIFTSVMTVTGAVCAFLDPLARQDVTCRRCCDGYKAVSTDIVP